MALLNMDQTDRRLALDFLPDDLREALHRFLQQGFEVWLVGGALRDLLWGWVPQDWDLAASASPQQVMEIFPRTVPIGLRHGTVQIHAGKMKIEVTSCPGPGMKGITADLRRRDFTVNALALSYPEGRLIDPFGGRADLFSRTLRAVDDAQARFREDPLRTLRAGRFMSVYGFGVDPETFAALKNEAPGLRRVAPERVREELFKMLPGQSLNDAFGWMVRGRVIQEILPEIAASSNNTDRQGDQLNLLEHTVNAVHCSPLRLRVRLGALFHNLAELRGGDSEEERVRDKSRFRRSALTAAEIMRRLRASRRLEQEVAFLVENQVPDEADDWTEAEVRGFLARIGEDLLGDVMDLACAKRLARKEGSGELRAFRAFRSKVFRELERKRPLRIQDLAFNGSDIMKILGLKPGPLVGELLQSLLRRVLEDPSLNEPKILMDFLVKEYDIKLNHNRSKEDDNAG